MMRSGKNIVQFIDPDEAVNIGAVIHSEKRHRRQIGLEQRDVGGNAGGSFVDVVERL
jgi:hypothetical protein